MVAIFVIVSMGLTLTHERVLRLRRSVTRDNVRRVVLPLINDHRRLPLNEEGVHRFRHRGALHQRARCGRAGGGSCRAFVARYFRGRASFWDCARVGGGAF